VTGNALKQLASPLQHAHRLPASLGTYPFPEATSLSIVLSRNTSATSFFSRMFSRSSSFSLLA
jgi:hypothetical protein